MLVQDAFSTEDNLANMKDKIQSECEKVSFRVKILKLKEHKTSVVESSLVTDIYKIELLEVFSRKAYLVMKRPKSKNIRIEEGACYIVDKVSLLVNKKNELIAMSTIPSVLIEYKLLRAADEDSHGIDSLD